MSRLLLPTAIVLTAGLSLPALAGNVQAERGYDDLRSYAVSTSTDLRQNISTQNQKNSTAEKAGSKFNMKFGSPDGNFESGRR